MKKPYQAKAFCRHCNTISQIESVKFSVASECRCKTCGTQLTNRGRWKCEETDKSIDYPRFPSEFEVQAYLYHELRKLGLDVRGCVSSRSCKAVFDLVIFSEDKKPLRVIEVKKRILSRKNVRRSTWKNQRSQMERYGYFETPVDLVQGMDQAIQYVKGISATIHG